MVYSGRRSSLTNVACRQYCRHAHGDHTGDQGPSLDLQVQPFGYDSSGAFSQAMHEYTEAHQWAYIHTILAHILLRSGPSMAIARQEPRKDCLRFRLVCQPLTPGVPRSQRNPATAFRVVEAGFWPIEYHFSATAEDRAYCAHLLKNCQAYHESNLRSAAADPESEFYAGVLPVLCVVEGVSIKQCNLFPVRYWQPRADLVIDRTVTTILGELIRFCVYTMGTPFPLRPALERTPLYAVPGRFVRPKGKKWTWEALFGEWAQYHAPGGASCGPLPGLEELGLVMSPSGLMNLYAMLFAVYADLSGKYVFHEVGCDTNR